MIDSGCARAPDEGHDEVAEHVRKSNVLIPLPCVTIFESDDNVKRILRGESRSFSSIIEGLKGRGEWRVKVYVDASKVKRIVETEDCEIAELDREIGESSGGKVYLLRKKREDLVRRAVESRIAQCGDICFLLLSKESENANLNSLLPMKKPHTDFDMVLNAVFLVRREAIPEFIDTVDYLRNRYDAGGFSFDHNGPWPSYDSCSALVESDL